MEDQKGFLWITTDAGISRFDGKHFQNFTTKDGLPDEEVLDAVMENNGRIWVNCFKQGASYFDEKKNRFINGSQDSNFYKVKGTRYIKLAALKDGGVMYSNENGSYIFKDGKFTEEFLISEDLGKVAMKQDDGSFLTFTIGQDIFSIFLVKERHFADSLKRRSWGNIKENNNALQDNKFYLLNSQSGTTYILSSFQINPLRYRIDSVSIGEPMLYQRNTPGYFSVISAKGSVYLFDKTGLKLQFVLNGNYSANTAYDDSKGNIWVCSVDKGLIMYKKKKIETYAIPDNFTNTNFLSIARKANGSLLAGNFTGEIIETDGRYFIVHLLPKSPGTSWQRKILLRKEKVISVSESGTYINYTTPVLNEQGQSLYSKTAATFNDSLIIQGSYGLSKTNIDLKKNTPLPSINKRVICIGIAGNMIYYGSTDGLYKFNFAEQKNIPLLQVHPLLSERIISICVSPDNLVWIATASYGILVLKNDKVIKTFNTENGIISSRIKCISPGLPGDIWIGTNNGITILRYKDNPSNYTYQNLTINDGLCSNIINEIVYDKDTMYCATGNGLSAIPARYTLDKSDIPVQLTSISINNRDTVIVSAYHLKSHQNKITLQFAGVELGGHFKYFQYSVDKSTWQVLDANTLVLELNSGKHSVEIKAIDVNGNTGSKPLQLTFTINTPFHRSFWFWLLLILVLVILAAWFIRKRELGKQEKALQAILNQKKLTELELQALKSQINPHFIFNCLNSIKLLNHQQKHKEAEIYLDRFAALLRSALEQSSLKQITLQQEMDFIENYLSLEQLRFPDKLLFLVEAAEDLKPSRLLIPSMMLQPYVENAVKHGIAPINGRPGLVQVRFYKKDQHLVAEVRDNGIGIDKATRSPGGTGIGIKNTERRSRLYNIETRITDLKSTVENDTGTLVQLIIPLQSP